MSSLWDAIFGLRDSSKEEIFKVAEGLAQPMQGEGEDLSLHTEMCARRFSALVNLSKAQFDQQKDSRTLILIALGMILFTRIDVFVAAIKALTKGFAE